MLSGVNEMNGVETSRGKEKIVLLSSGFFDFAKAPLRMTDAIRLELSKQ